MNSEVLISKPMRRAGTLSAPDFPIPPGACDAHVHVFGPESIYPRVSKPHYTLPDGSLPQLKNALGALGIERFVVVQPSFYGTDNRCMLDTLDSVGINARGVAMVSDDVSFEELTAMHARGVRAIRLDMFLRSSLSTARLRKFIGTSIERTRSLGWHVQFYTPGWVVRDLIPFLPELESDFVIDHMGYMLESDGLTRVDFDRLLAAVAKGKGWFKLSGPYRLAKDGNFARLKPLAKAIIEAVPDRVIWGSDWPHIPEGDRDTGELLNLFADWVPEPTMRKKILVDNPTQLFGFNEVGI
ncbi:MULTISPECIES: amidohydrolase [unclassified Variovorax]|uniref:amidohydrolase family protein n=1 Tax=unclassified Variovorax TaxID=663243 RepID=UPI0008D2E84E|nr:MULTISPECIES: amidohydrolase family protein [unclassified Variovorax]SEK17304.1 Predicted metal-dependent hydrolase, TIM-barrel fold [Variovorax sp. OK202]SFE78746.1 Predicted metal-dependent hydrolase, TIM-barrel fold [Variovorax sp. OK212]